jgi:cyclomaltodextrinase / maltogenic alpha-amylase / neopullulanase
MTSNRKKSLFFWENSRLDERFVLPVENGFEIKIPADAKKMERSFIRIWSYNENGPSNELLIPLAKGSVITDPSLLTREDKHATILYFMMIDRFKNGNPG